MDENVRLKAREFLLRARIYRFCAGVSAFVGIGVFIVLYFRHMSDGGWREMLQFSNVLIIVIPFLPAFLLSGLSARAENKFLKILESAQATNAADATPPKKK